MGFPFQNSQPFWGEVLWGRELICTKSIQKNGPSHLKHMRVRQIVFHFTETKKKMGLEIRPETEAPIPENPWYYFPTNPWK